MTLAATTKLNAAVEAFVPATFAPISLVAPWSNAIDAGGVATIDAATITDAAGSITDVHHHILTRLTGTLLVLALAYDKTLTAITAPILKVFGRVSAAANGGVAGRWELLKNRAGNIQTTLTPAATDAVSGTLAYTTVDLTNHAVDMAGCDEFLVGVETALAGSTGVVTSAVVLARNI